MENYELNLVGSPDGSEQSCALKSEITDEDFFKPMGSEILLPQLYQAWSVRQLDELGQEGLQHHLVYWYISNCYLETIVLLQLNYNRYCGTPCNITLFHCCRYLFQSNKMVFYLPEIYAAMIHTNPFSALRGNAGTTIRNLLYSEAKDTTNSFGGRYISFLAASLYEEVSVRWDGEMISERDKYHLTLRSGAVTQLKHDGVMKWTVHISWNDFSGGIDVSGELEDIMARFWWPRMEEISEEGASEYSVYSTY
ncbi:uncharacterized protein N7506_000067 [Penicillium brevicompactum]|uniref:uncharacterized protein n=1 Tax=Penicillium brevicompactum TaxID=5074 RepID=UPI0025402FF5|nr:uncharacterized protein N7506_000067 [Penicillium brevicompactum]KAJ5346814.1 hypothetical protein N7506_000067 [Penicillium brevicompactum]